jgi:hypothetical protein
MCFNANCEPIVGEFSLAGVIGWDVTISIGEVMDMASELMDDDLHFGLAVFVDSIFKQLRDLDDHPRLPGVWQDDCSDFSEIHTLCLFGSS